MTNQGDQLDMPRWLEGWLWRQRRTRLAISAAIGVVAGVLTAVFGSWFYAPAVGWLGRHGPDIHGHSLARHLAHVRPNDGRTGDQGG